MTKEEALLFKILKPTFRSVRVLVSLADADLTDIRKGSAQICWGCSLCRAVGASGGPVGTMPPLRILTDLLTQYSNQRGQTMPTTTLLVPPPFQIFRHSYGSALCYPPLDMPQNAYEAIVYVLNM